LRATCCSTRTTRESAPGSSPATDVYGGRDLRKSIRARGTGYVLAIRSSYAVTLPSGRRLSVKTASNLPGIERAALLTSELVTNSINHSNSRGKAGTITVTVLTGAGRVHVEVADEGGPTVPAICRGNDLAEGGRGLRLVDAYSLSWDYYQKGTGMVTWFECPAEPLP
jgi:anti-sigma regulatory factor (Ser/Thr protein kinase)